MQTCWRGFILGIVTEYVPAFSTFSFLMIKAFPSVFHHSMSLALKAYKIKTLFQFKFQTFEYFTLINSAFILIVKSEHEKTLQSISVHFLVKQFEKQIHLNFRSISNPSEKSIEKLLKLFFH